MKIPEDAEVVTGSDNIRSTFYRVSNEIAYRLGMEYGVWVQSNIERDSEGRITRIYFSTMGHQFESAQELEKALKNKAFA